MNMTDIRDQSLNKQTIQYNKGEIYIATCEIISILPFYQVEQKNKTVLPSPS